MTSGYFVADFTSVDKEAEVLLEAKKSFKRLDKNKDNRLDLLETTKMLFGEVGEENVVSETLHLIEETDKNKVK